MVAATLDQAEIVTALKAGRYYSSSGATINAIELDGDRVTISCSPARSVVISGAGHQARAEVGTNITKASFDLGNFKSRMVSRHHCRRGWMCLVKSLLAGDYR